MKASFVNITRSPPDIPQPSKSGTAVVTFVADTSAFVWWNPSRTATQKRESEIKQQVVERLEKYYRNMKSIVFQVNKRYLTKKRPPLAFIDNIAESGECFIKNQDTRDNDYLFLLYIKGENASERLINDISLEDRTNNVETKVFNPKNVFGASDYIIDRLAILFERERQLKKSNN